ncbi:hypothetical protein GEMRC1_006699 [Eukaryota sp. GEM-RC1]
MLDSPPTGLSSCQFLDQSILTLAAQKNISQNPNSSPDSATLRLATLHAMDAVSDLSIPLSEVSLSKEAQIHGQFYAQLVSLLDEESV